MNLCIPVDEAGQVGHGWGRAASVALATLSDAAQVVTWEVHPVGWDVLHGEGSEGSHHARIVRFLREHQVDGVVVEHMGLGMRRVMHAMGIPVFTGAAGDARAALEAAARVLTDSPAP